MNQATIFRARIRFRVAMRFNVTEAEVSLVLVGYRATLSAEKLETAIRDSHWLVLRIYGLESEQVAHEVGGRVKLACDVASVANRLGLDSGSDAATDRAADAVKAHVLQATGVVLRDNVHGLDVYPETPESCTLASDVRVEGYMNAQPFLSMVEDLSRAPMELSRETRDVVLLLNYALMRSEPESRIVYAFSAVEMLGQNEQWSECQSELLDSLATAARNMTYATAEEREEVAQAIERGAHRLSLRQGVMRLLDRLQLAALRNEWDRLYGRRSELVHGLVPQPGVSYVALADEVVCLCGYILLTAVGKEVPGVMAHRDVHFPVTAGAG